ncbi:MAG TPA: right-handed parallel beta-helix repeat-containing protein, partial [Planctomycetaceae bacterium]|nr:right-handed parallel beta-helix repeat-containing protein [Planctomycetaceae bacterium]
EQRATLAPANSDTPTPQLVEINQVTGVLMKGWKIEAPREGNAIYLVEVGNITLENLEIEQPADVGIFGAIQVHAKRCQTADGPIEITGCHIQSNGNAQCVWIQATSQPPSEIRLTRNRFERRTGEGTNVAVWVEPDSSLSKLILRENVFINGRSALNFVLKGRLPPHSVDIVNNTFFQSQHWLAFNTQQISEPLARAANNLIIGGERIQTDTREGLDETARNWEFRANWWERGALTDWDATRSGLIAESKPEQSLRFLSRDPDHADFLRPAADAQWLNAGIGGTELQYLGAFGPHPATVP